MGKEEDKAAKVLADANRAENEAVAPPNKAENAVEPDAEKEEEEQAAAGDQLYDPLKKTKSEDKDKDEEELKDNGMIQLLEKIIAFVMEVQKRYFDAAEKKLSDMFAKKEKKPEKEEPKPEEPKPEEAAAKTPPAPTPAAETPEATALENSAANARDAAIAARAANIQEDNAEAIDDFSGDEVEKEMFNSKADAGSRKAAPADLFEDPASTATAAPQVAADAAVPKPLPSEGSSSPAPDQPAPPSEAPSSP